MQHDFVGNPLTQNVCEDIQNHNYIQDVDLSLQSSFGDADLCWQQRTVSHFKKEIFLKESSPTHDTIAKCWTDHKFRTHTNDRTRDCDDKRAPPPYLELSCTLQQKAKEEQK